MGLNVDRTINNIENALTDVSAYPVVGTLAGCVKVAMGAVQGLTGLACGILAIIPAAATGCWSPVKHSWTHIKHGIGNMVAGTLEAIPLVQTVLYGIRHLRNSEALYVYTGHDSKFMPYTSLVELDWGFGSCVDDHVAIEKAKKIFNDKINMYCDFQADFGTQNIPIEIKLKLAREAIYDSYKRQ